MKAVAQVLVAAALLTACGAKHDASTVKAEHTAATDLGFDANWLQIGNNTVTGGFVAGTLSVAYPMALTQIDQVAVAFPSQCGILAVDARILAPLQTVTPTHLSSVGQTGGFSVLYYAVNGNAFASVNQVNLEITMSAGGICSPVATLVHKRNIIPFGG
jgi:hypothetical protein